MKKVILLHILIVCSLSLKAQKDTVGLNLPLNNGHIIYEKVIEVPGLTKQELYKNAKQWFIDYFNSSKDVIQNEDKEEGIIIGKGILIMELQYQGKFIVKLAVTTKQYDKVTIMVECKDSKYRYKVYDQQIAFDQTDLNTYYTPELWIDQINGKNKFGVNKKGLRMELASTDKSIKIAIISLNAKMSSKSDNF